MIEIGGTQFPLTFGELIEGRQLVHLGVVQIGALERRADGRFAWSLALPMMPQRPRRASTADSARGRIIDEVMGWLQAAATVRNVPQRARASA